MSGSLVPSGATTARQLLALQGRVGNSAVQAFMRGAGVQSSPGSAHAKAVQRQPATDLLSSPAESSVDLERLEEPADSSPQSSTLTDAPTAPSDGSAAGGANGGAAGGSAGGPAAGGIGGSAGGAAGAGGAGSAGGASGGAASGGSAFAGAGSAGGAAGEGPASANGSASSDVERPSRGRAAGASGAAAGAAAGGQNARSLPTGASAGRRATAAGAAAKLTKRSRTDKRTPSGKPAVLPALGPAGKPVREPSKALAGGSESNIADAPDPLAASVGSVGGAAVTAAVNAAAAFWDSMDTPTKIRTGLELTRPIPVLGILTGMASDAIGLVTDLQAVPAGNDMTVLTIGARDAIALFGNVLGGAAAADQTLQDIISVTPLAPADVITAGVNEALLGAKIWTDSASMFLDVVIMAEARYNKASGPQDAATLSAWDGIFKSFGASMLSDTVTTVIDGLDLVALGFTNGQSTSSVAKAIATAMKRFVPLARTIVGVVLNEFSIHGFRLAPGIAPPTAAGGATAAGAPSPGGTSSAKAAGPAPATGATNALGQRLPAGGDAVADEAAMLALDSLIGGLGIAYGVWQITDGQIGEAEDSMRAAEAQTRALIAQVSGGKDPFIVIRDAAKQSVDKAAASIGEMIEMGQMAGELITDADAMREGCDATLALLANMRVPDVHLPRPTGDGLLDQAEALAASVADQAFQFALGGARAQVDSIREELSRPVHTVRAHATEIANFNKALQETCTEGAAKLQAHIQLFSAKLGHVQNFEQVVDLLLHELTEALGVEGGAGIADVRKAWADAGDALLWGQTAAQSVRAQIGTPRARRNDDAVAGPAAEPPEPPPPGDAAPTPPG